MSIRTLLNSVICFINWNCLEKIIGKVRFLFINLINCLACGKVLLPQWSCLMRTWGKINNYQVAIEKSMVQQTQNHLGFFKLYWWHPLQGQIWKATPQKQHLPTEIRICPLVQPNIGLYLLWTASNAGSTVANRCIMTHLNRDELLAGN